MAFSREGSANRKAFSSAIPLVSRQIFTQTTKTHLGQKYSSTYADTACYYQCPTLLIIHTDFLSGYNITQLETRYSLCLQVEFIRVDLSFYIREVSVGKDSKSLLINWELYYSPSPHHFQFLPQPLEPDAE